MASIFKSLTNSDFAATPFPAYYKYSYTYESGSTTNSSDVTISYAEKYVAQDSIVRSPNVRYELFDSIKQVFYSPAAYALYGINESSYIPSASSYVISITQDVFGNTILPGSFSIQMGTSQSYDDGKGNVIVSSSGTGSIVGTVFYDKGVAVLKPTSSIAGGGLTSNGIFIPSSSTVNVRFTSSFTVYENTIRTKLNPTDFLYSVNNPTVESSLSGSVSTPISLMVSQSLRPYVTTIGFYNDKNELLLVAKPSVPVQRTSDSPQTFIVRFDI